MAFPNLNQSRRRGHLQRGSFHASSAHLHSRAGGLHSQAMGAHGARVQAVRRLPPLGEVRQGEVQRGAHSQSFGEAVHGVSEHVQGSGQLHWPLSSAACGTSGGLHPASLTHSLSTHRPIGFLEALEALDRKPQARSKMPHEEREPSHATPSCLTSCGLDMLSMLSEPTSIMQDDCELMSFVCWMFLNVLKDVVGIQRCCDSTLTQV